MVININPFMYRTKTISINQINKSDIPVITNSINPDQVPSHSVIDPNP